MPVESEQVTVGTGSPSPLVGPDGNGAYALFKNVGGNPVFLGDASVTTVSGFLLAASGGTLPAGMVVPPGEGVYAIASGGNSAVHVLRSG